MEKKKKVGALSKDIPAPKYHVCTDKHFPPLKRMNSHLLGQLSSSPLLYKTQTMNQDKGSQPGQPCLPGDI